MDLGHRSSGCVSEGATVLRPCLKGLMAGEWWLCPVWSLPGWVGPMVVFQSSDCSKIRTAPTSGGSEGS